MKHRAATPAVRMITLRHARTDRPRTSACFPEGGALTHASDAILSLTFVLCAVDPLPFGIALDLGTLDLRRFFAE
jgi:hypothetical protein